ncbi:MAG: NUDIX domain-containing protein [Pseudonocardiaceae bacterium]|nr:NUDIX domain-containing protein [Pseudonocardiaceae bacterium]
MRSTILIEAPVHTVSAALREPAVLRAAAADAGHRTYLPHPGGGLLVPGDEVRFGVRVLPGLRLPLRTRVNSATVDVLDSRLLAGPLPRLRHRAVLAPTAAGTLLTDEIDWVAPGGRLGRLFDVMALRRIVLQTLAARAERVRARAEELAERSAPVIVGAAVLSRGRLLAAQRSYPEAVAGRWELPGGRVEAGETEQQALARECREELGIDVVPDGRLGPDVPLPGGGVLRVHVGVLAAPGASPRALEHRAVSWVEPDRLDELDWLDADRVLVPELRTYLDTDRECFR